MKAARAAAPALSLLCALTGGCSGLLHSSAQPEQTYYLRPPAAAAGAAAAAMTVSLRVGRPQAAPGLDSPHIMLVQADHRMNFYASSRWAGPVPDVVEALAVETLRASGAWASVEDSTSPFPSDYLLQVAVRRFEADYAAGGAAPEVHVVLDCIIGRREGRDVIGTFAATGNASAAANRLGEVVSAFEQAIGAALGTLSQQATQVVRADAERNPQNADKPAPSISRQSQ